MIQLFFKWVIDFVACAWGCRGAQKDAGVWSWTLIDVFVYSSPLVKKKIIYQTIRLDKQLKSKKKQSSL